MNSRGFLRAMSRGRFVGALCIALAMAGVSHAGGIDWLAHCQKDGTLLEGRLGQSVEWLGDINGDGTVDFAVGAPYASPGGVAGAGSVSIYSGADCSLLYQKDGSVAAGRFGMAIASLGDLTGDGRPDYAIGAPAMYPSPGAVFVYNGATGALIQSVAGSGQTIGLGTAIAGLGDVNSDGVPDFVAGAPSTSLLDQLEGRIIGYSGATFAVLYTLNGPFQSRLGSSLASLGVDISNDGIQDFIAGAPYYTIPRAVEVYNGGIYLFSGADGAAISFIVGNDGNDHFGWAVAALGDYSGDGFVDFAVGAPDAEEGGSPGDAGAVYTYRWVPAAYSWGNGYTLTGTGANDHFGKSIAGFGDVNGDQRADFVVGAPDASPSGVTGAGSAYVYSGASPGTLLVRKDGTAVGDQFGTSLRAGQDVNSDGKPDLIVGIPAADPGAVSNAGSALVMTACDCLHHGDPTGDGIESQADINFTSAVVFGGEPDTIDVSCPHIGRSDHNCDCIWDIVDLVYITNHVRRGGPAPCKPCDNGLGCPR